MGIAGNFRALQKVYRVVERYWHSLISERTRAGVKAARRRGVKFGRKPKLTPQQIAHAQKLIEDGQRREDRGCTV